MLAIRQAAITTARQTMMRRIPIAMPRVRTMATENASSDNKKDSDNDPSTSSASKDKAKDAAPAKDQDTSDHAKILSEKDKKIAELQDAYLRCLADQENLRERSRKEIASSKEFAIQKFAKDLLDTVDILGMALTSVPQELRAKETAKDVTTDVEKLTEQLTSLYTGVSMTETELIKTLKRHGVEQYNPEGDAFDPNKHQALFQTPIPDKEPGTVFSVQKVGYMLKGRVLRPAQVGVVAESQ